jgi:predicted ATPase
MDVITNNGYELKNLAKINIILGKNGSGKSNLLRDIDHSGTLGKNENLGKIKYITPERGGSLKYEPGIETQIVQNALWLSNTRRKNREESFKQQTVAQFRNLETTVLREIEKERRGDSTYSFDSYISEINSLLENIEIRREGSTFNIYNKVGDRLGPEIISSGESELISLAIEVNVFAKEALPGKTNILCFDEPDVHLHPDSQIKLMNLLKTISSREEIVIFIATHSTAFLNTLTEEKEARIAFKQSGEENLEFKEVSEEYQKILPVFGAHPLTNVFNSSPILLVEGEDEERIWQQVVRTSEGKIRLYPCSTNSISEMNKYELTVDDIASAIYDDPKAYSLRDKDDKEGKLANKGILERFRLECRTSENLILTDEVLAEIGIDWKTLELKMNNWLDDESNNSHPKYIDVESFRNVGYDRKKHNLKSIRMLLVGYFMNNNKPWEVLVGQTIGKINWRNYNKSNEENTLGNFLGKEFIDKVLKNN